MTRSSRWLPVSFVAALAIAALPAAGVGAAGSRPEGSKPSKLPYIVEQFAADVAQERSRGRNPARLSNTVLHATADGAVELTFHAAGRVGGAERGSLQRLGASVVALVSEPPRGGHPAMGMIQARVPAGAIDDAAALDWVAAVTPPGYGEPDTHPTNPLNSEGVAFHNADDVQGRGVNGAGVTVGVISDGVTSIATSQAQNELPAVTVLDAGAGDEGTAMLEIVHDMAPGAALMFDGTGGGTANHIASLNNLVTNGADVITEDIPFDAEPAFQQGAVAVAGDNIAAAGVSVHSSAGNQAQRHAARVAATGTGGTPDGTTFTTTPPTGCANTPDNVVAIAPGGDTTFDVTLGNGASFTLQWSEPRAIFPTAGQGGFTDLNLYVMNAALTQCLGQSVTVQGNGQGDTIEQIALPGSLNGTNAKIVVDVQGVAGAVAAPLIDLRWRRAGATDNTTRAGSLNPDSNYTGQATSSAALDAQNAGAIEGFSSGGPVQLIQTTVCAPADPPPCAGVAGPSQTSGAPTWAAADNVTVSGVGGFGSPFTGTSAAAPHAAGCDALLRDETNAPAAAPATTNARLIATAVDVAPAGTDNVTGAGRLDCLLAVNDPPVAEAGGPYATSEGVDVMVSAAGSTDPDTGDTLTYAWDLDNNGSYETAGVTATFTDVGQDGAFTVGLRVTDGANATSTDTATVTVSNVAPTVGTITTDSPKDENQAMRFTGSISDPGWEELLTATIDFDDGLGPQPLVGTLENVRPDATLSYDVLHTYGDNGTYTVQICAADDDTTGNCNSTVVTVQNVNPTATIDLAGTTLVNGIPTFVAHAGQTIPFSGRSTDPGSDDLTLTWDWDDGPPSPDVTTVYLVNPPSLDPAKSPSIQPRDVTDSQPHAFGDACLYTITFASGDDDGGSASQTAKVIVVGNALLNRSAGYWYQQFRERNVSFFSTQTLECYLEIVGYMSTVFNEAKDASTIAKARAILNPPTTKTTVLQQFDRQLLAAWLNFANGAIGLTSPVDTDGDGVNDSTFAAAVAAAEAVRLNPASTSAQLIQQKNVLERINLRDGG